MVFTTALTSLLSLEGIRGTHLWLSILMSILLLLLTRISICNGSMSEHCLSEPHSSPSAFMALWQIMSPHFSATAIINCTGLATAELAEDNTCYPLCSALIHVINDGFRYPCITSAMSISLDGRNGKQDMVFIVLWNNNTLILGSLAEPNQWDLDINLNNYPPIKAMYNRCLKFTSLSATARSILSILSQWACNHLGKLMLGLRGS